VHLVGSIIRKRNTLQKVPEVEEIKVLYFPSFWIQHHKVSAFYCKLWAQCRFMKTS